MAYPAFSNVAASLQNFGVVDFLLPFILVFTIVFAVMQRTKILGENKNFNVIIALVLGLLFVIPHITGSYPLGYDPVAVMNQSLPSISLVAIASIMLLLLMGIFSTDFSKTAAPIIAVVAIGFVLYIFGAALNLWTGPYAAFSWWTPDLTELIIVILVFGVIVWFITREPGSKTPGQGIMEGLAKLFEKK
ncbi:hypothetical protein HYU22_01100 [Candidatus Woesearchaeota archaeon]|nr:hypothetical protein [Candidatus Woesearchaeota archaeon]